jgi:uncharacterized protein (TIGR02145 family)
MLTRNLVRIFVIIISIFLYSCKTEEVIVNGDINGLVTDAENSQPIHGAIVKLLQYTVITDTTRTVNDGTYNLKIIPGDYAIQASKYGYSPENGNIKVVAAMTKTMDFRLNKIPTLNVSTNLLDFGLDSTTLKFNISKTGTGTLTYALSKSQNWITVSPSGGEITDEADTIAITANINKTGLDERIYKETITVAQYISPDESNEVTIDVYLNGLLDINGNYYKVVKIGTQIWMAENLNIGNRIESGNNQTDNEIIEKYCYNDLDYNCDIYGGLYQWDEMMQYHPAEDTSIITGDTQGICPNGWHIPTYKEWETLSDTLGVGAGGKLKEAGFEHWIAPNTGATNESGFTGLPGGAYQPGVSNTTKFFGIGQECDYWSSMFWRGDQPWLYYLVYDGAYFIYLNIDADLNGGAVSVRCLKNP